MLIKFQTAFVIFCYNVLGSTTVNFPEGEYAGSPCGEGEDKGICTSAEDCPIAKEAIVKFRRHNLERCGFEGFTEIVCCPNKQANTRGPLTLTSGGGRKSSAACKEYANTIPPNTGLLILGGENATLGEFPHMVTLGYENPQGPGLVWECGGSLISERFVLTAAHCIVKTDGIQPTRLRMGIIDITGSDNIEPEDYNIKNITIHPNYQPRSKLHDIALIEMDGSSTISVNVHPACLYQKSDNPLGLVITGWGHTSSSGEPSVILQKAMIRPVDGSECNEVYVNRLSRTITNSQICAVSDDGLKDTCQGDSGGPLQVQEVKNSSIYTIVGITSYGMGCGGNVPGIYTRVYSYLDWIEGIVWS